MNVAVAEVLPPQQMVTEITPMQMLQYAMSQNADLDRLQKFMDLHLQWEKNQARKAFDRAISLAKAEIKPILKNREVDFKTDKGRTNYQYEDFAQIAIQVDPILAKHGLSYRHRPRQEGSILHITCIVSHCDGHSEESTLSAGNDMTGNKNAIQSVGSAATYLQRYTLKLALGLAAARDDDGAGSKKPPQEQAPDGYDSWKADMTALADDGLKALTGSWAKSAGAFRRWVVKYDERWWTETKAIAGKVEK